MSTVKSESAPSPPRLAEIARTRWKSAESKNGGIDTWIEVPTPNSTNGRSVFDHCMPSCTAFSMSRNSARRWLAYSTSVALSTPDGAVRYSEMTPIVPEYSEKFSWYATVHSPLSPAT